MNASHVIREDSGTITIAASAVADIVARSVEEVDGARVHRRRRGLEIDVGNGHARVSVELTARYGEPLPDLAHAVQQRVAERLRSMCGLGVDAIDVCIEELEGA